MRSTDFNASLRDMNDDELSKTIALLRSDIFGERGKISQFGMGYSEKGKSDAIIRPLKRDLARALTEQNRRKNA